MSRIRPIRQNTLKRKPNLVHMAEPVILINAFEVPAADAESFTAAWEKTRDYLETQPGYIDTALHRALAPNAEFQFVNVARWQTPEEFRAATHHVVRT